MKNQTHLIEEIEYNLYQQERIYDDFEAFNKHRNNNENLILYLNIRSLNANFDKLEILIKNLKIKPYVIVCTEVWQLAHFHYYKINDYNIYYNQGDINKNDGVVIYIRDDVIQSTETISIGKLKILNTIITLSNSKILEISSLYRSHDLSYTEFNCNLKSYLVLKRKVRNHIIIGDFNINIQECNATSIDFLNNLLEKGFFPSFIKTTRPKNLTTEIGTCIDNIFVKTDFLITKPLTLRVPITDHYPLFLVIKNGNLYANKKTTNKNEYYINYNSLFNNTKQIDWTKYKNIKNQNVFEKN